jgi:MFS family permease
MAVVNADVVSVSAEGIDSFPKKALAASAIGYAMDGFDLLILGFMLRAISAELHLTPPQAGSLVTSTLVGAVAGGILFGTLSDYYGRVRALTWTNGLNASRCLLNDPPRT